MNLKKSNNYYLFFVLVFTLFFECTEDDCTKMINIPKYDHNQMTFVDNFQEVPCDFEEPAVEPVN
jgi:hypothetical protein